MASLAGLPKEIINRAKEILVEIENKNKLKNNIQLSLFAEAEKLANDNKEGLENKEILEKQKELYTKISNIDIDDLSAKQALDLLYELQQDTK